jgi:hypothetical protein
MRLIHLLVTFQVGLTVALPTPDLSKDDVYPRNATEGDMSRVIPCDRKTLKVYIAPSFHILCLLARYKCHD